MTLKEFEDKYIKFGMSQLILLGGRPAMGKTSFADSIALDIAENERNEIRIIHFGDEDAIWEKRTSLHAKKYAKENYNTIKREDCNSLSVEEIRNRLEEYIGQLTLIIVDYMQLINRGDDGVDEVIKGLRDIADEQKCPVIVVSQLPRAIDNRENHIPEISDLKVCQIDVSKFDEIMLIYREHYYDRNADATQMSVVTSISIESLTWDYDTCTVE